MARPSFGYRLFSAAAIRLGRRMLGEALAWWSAPVILLEMVGLEGLRGTGGAKR